MTELRNEVGVVLKEPHCAENGGANSANYATLYNFLAVVVGD